jgi:hypothetical protein
MEKWKIEINSIQEAEYIDFRLLNDDEDKAFNNLEKHLKELYPFLK